MSETEKTTDERPDEPKPEAKPAAPIFTPPPLHTTQTTKQPVIWRCPAAECRESSLDRYFEFESDYPTCPKCGAGPPSVHKRVLIHLLIPDTNGRIHGERGRRFRIACAPVRGHLATRTNGEAATGDLAAANCAGCLAAVGNKELRSFPFKVN